MGWEGGGEEGAEGAGGGTDFKMQWISYKSLLEQGKINTEDRNVKMIICALPPPFSPSLSCSPHCLILLIGFLLCITRNENKDKNDFRGLNAGGGGGGGGGGGEEEKKRGSRQFVSNSFSRPQHRSKTFSFVGFLRVFPPTTKINRVRPQRRK